MYGAVNSDKNRAGTLTGETRRELTGIRDGPVPKPVGCHRERHCLGTDLEGEYLASDDPCDGSPCRGEECDVEANECYLCGLCGLVAQWRSRTDDGNDEFADGHANRTNEKQATATVTLDTPNAGDGHSDVDRGSGDRDKIGVVESGVGEESRAEVEDKVDASELLPGLDEDTRQSTEADAIVRGSEAVKVRT